MALIGFSTGTLYKKEIPIEKKIDMFSSIGANAIELSFGYPQDLVRFKETFRVIPEVLGALLEKFDFVSFHAPFQKISYGSRDAEETLRILKDMSCFVRNGFVFHPSEIGNERALSDSGIDVLIENLDRKKDFGNMPQDLHKFRDMYGGFVLDIYHAYQMDPTMVNIPGFLRVMDGKLRHLHVSGSTNSLSHTPLHSSDNKEVISSAVRQVFEHGKYPIILEGKMSHEIDIKSVASRELDYIRRIVQE